MDTGKPSNKLHINIYTGIFHNRPIPVPRQQVSYRTVGYWRNYSHEIIKNEQGYLLNSRVTMVAASSLQLALSLMMVDMVCRIFNSHDILLGLSLSIITSTWCLIMSVLNIRLQATWLLLPLYNTIIMTSKYLLHGFHITRAT